MHIRLHLAGILTILGLLGLPSAALAQAADDQPTPVARGPHISGVVHFIPRNPSSSSGSTTATPLTCSTPGGTNYRTDCHSNGRPVNETSMAWNGSSLFVAGANDYNSYNGQGQDGYYWSSDGKSWNDAGPIDVFPHNQNNAAGDPGLAIGSSGVVYYSSLFFNFHNCGVGGVELLRLNPSTGKWTYTQIASNSQTQFQDKPAITIDGSHVYESWTQFGSCSGSNVPSPIRVAVLPTGASSVAPSQILTNVPGSTYSQGSSIVADGSGNGFWLAWEEWPSATAVNGTILLAHWTNGSWTAPQTVTPNGITDLASPLPGFKFRTNSFPQLTLSTGVPQVAWTSEINGVGRAQLWSGTNAGSTSVLADSGSDQFFPAMVADGAGGVYVSYSQSSGNSTYDQYYVRSGTASKVTTASSSPNNDAFFSGQFIGDYNGLVFTGTAGSGVHPIWTDIRGPDPKYPGYEMDSMVYSS